MTVKLQLNFSNNLFPVQNLPAVSAEGKTDLIAFQAFLCTGRRSAQLSPEVATVHGEEKGFTAGQSLLITR